jgi:hypothetical protein
MKCTLLHSPCIDPTAVSPISFDSGEGIDITLFNLNTFDADSNISRSNFDKGHPSQPESDTESADYNNHLPTLVEQNRNIDSPSSSPDGGVVGSSVLAISKEPHGMDLSDTEDVSYPNSRSWHTIKAIKHASFKSTSTSRDFTYKDISGQKFTTVMCKKTLTGDSRSRHEAECAKAGVPHGSKAFSIYVDLDGDVSVLSQRFGNLN